MNGDFFGRRALELEARGFDVIPVTLPWPGDKDAGKKPAPPDWQVPCNAAARLPRYAHCGVGILTARTPAVDLDVRLQELADELHRTAAAVLGDAPVRYGAPPKRLLPYQTATPFPKIATAGYALPGDQAGDKPHRVEVLADGQQFVAFGVHPELGRPYAWPDGSLLDLERQDLPEIDAAAAARFVAMAERRLLAHGGWPVERSGGRRLRSAGWQAGPPPRSVRSLGEARQVLAALKRLPNTNLPYDDWLAVAYALKAALGEKAGCRVFMAWSRQAEAKHDDATAEHRWRTIKPSKAGWRYLLKLVEAADAR